MYIVHINVNNKYRICMKGHNYDRNTKKERNTINLHIITLINIIVIIYTCHIIAHILPQQYIYTLFDYYCILYTYRIIYYSISTKSVMLRCIHSLIHILIHIIYSVSI